MSVEAVNMSKDELLQTVVALKRAAEDSGGRIENLEKASTELTDKYRQLRNVATEAQSYTAAGTDAEAFQRYTAPAEAVRQQMVTSENRERVRYGNEARKVTGREYAGNKNAPHAIRMLSEYDELGNCEPGLLDDPEPATPWQHRLQQLAEQRSLVRALCAERDQHGQYRPGASHKTDAALRRHIQRGPEWVKQVFSDNAGEGAEFIPDVVLAELGRRLEMPRNVVGLFQVQRIGTGGTTRNPFLVAGCQPFQVPVPVSGDLDSASIQRSVPSTTTLTADPKTWGVSLPASRDATEDSIIEWGAFGNMMLVEAVRDGEEDAFINADPNGGDTGLANWNIRSRWNTLGHISDHRSSYIGLRAHSFDAASAGALAAESAVGLTAELIHMDSPQFMDDVVWITSPEFVLLKLLTDPNLLTVDKYGSLATILTGEVGRIMGKPLVMSEFVDVQYNASGVYDHVTRTKTGVLAVNRKRWAVGERRGPRVEVETIAHQHMQILTLTQRRFLRHLGRSTEKSVTWQYNASAS